MNDTFIKFRKEYPEFIYENFKVTETDTEYKVTYLFSIKDLVFEPQITILKNSKMENIDNDYLNYLFFQYGLLIWWVIIN